MPRRWLAGWLGVVGLAWGWAGPPAWAGLYVSLEPLPIAVDPAGKAQPLPFGQLQFTLAELAAVGKPPLPGMAPTPERKAYLAARDRLLGGNTFTSRLTPEQTADLGAILIRLREYDPAITILRRATQQERPTFQSYTALAVLHLLRGEAHEALRVQQPALDIFPEQLPGATAAQTAWYRQLERTYFKRLIVLRARERDPVSGKSPLPESVDDLFGVRFVDEAGQYRPGQLAAAERQKLPADALAIVQQLVLWLPDDSRLYWLLGEVYAAQGDPASLQAAGKILDQCVDSRQFHPKELGEHRRVVRELLAQQRLPDDSVDPTPPTPAPSGQLLTWDARTISVIVGVGLVAVGLVALQVRQLVKRRR